MKLPVFLLACLGLQQAAAFWFQDEWPLQACDDSCEQCSTSEIECLTCKSGYVLVPDYGYCVACDPNCAVCTEFDIDNNRPRCDQCSEEYALTPEGE